ncbi:MAG: hypothetical protein AAF985_24925, partial [Bacteroidota bacterium]
MQFAIEWDPAKLTLLGIENYHPSFTTAGFPNIGSNSVVPGQLLVIWIDQTPSLDGITLSDGESLFSLSFQVNTPEIAEVSLGEGLSGAGVPFVFEVVQGGVIIPSESFSGFNNPNGAFISGNVFEDANGNCANDLDLGLRSWSVKASGAGGTFYRMTDDLGNYRLPVEAGTYEIEAIPPVPYWASTCAPTYSVAATTIGESYTQDIPVSTTISCPYMEVDLSAPFLRRCFDNNSMQISYCNNGSEAASDAYIELDLDDDLSIVIATHPYTLVNGLYRFELGEVGVGECGRVGLKVEVGCEDVELGQTHCSVAHIYPDNFCVPTSPSWSGASLEVQGECIGDQVHFTITNVGAGNMAESSQFIIIEDAVMGASTPFQLNSGESYPTISLPANGSTYRILVDQVANHPGVSKPTIAIEACGSNGSGAFSTGFVNLFAEDDENHFVDVDCQENIGSYDPNDKQGLPRGYGEENNIEANTSLEYRIRFQNTGTDTAFNVVVLDTISEFLDLTSIRLGASSHPYEFDIIGNNVLKFSFENIMLPDSFVNEPASNGFLKYTIGQLADNEPGTRIENSAAIYFDFNEPVITNTVFHTIAEEIFTVGIYPQAILQRIESYPNPFREAITFDLKSEDYSSLRFDLFDLLGNQLRSEVHSASPFEVQRG